MTDLGWSSEIVDFNYMSAQSPVIYTGTLLMGWQDVEGGKSSIYSPMTRAQSWV